MTDSSRVTCPVLEEDVFSDENLANSAPLYKRVRDMGDAVWVPRIDQYVVARYDDVVKSLKAADKLISGKGVSVNETQNQMFSDQPEAAHASSLTSDGARHSLFKRYEMKPLLRNNVITLKDDILALADGVIKDLADGQTFEGMSALASYLPLQIISKMVGVKELDNDKMLRWAGALFDAFGPEYNPRTLAAYPVLGEYAAFHASLNKESLIPGGWADQLMDGVTNGDLTPEEAHGLVGSYIVPSLDTTIHSTGELVYQLAKKPELYERLKENPDLIDSAVLEAVRLATPLRGFTRFVAEDFQLTDSTLPAGSRVWLWYASANRDERHYPNPDQFDLDRNPVDNIGWGHGPHSCIGKHLAQMEIRSILQSLIKYVDRIELDDSCRIVNNSAQGYESLTMRLIPRG
ncbi:MAG: cytochrome P450 [Halieaceae bacterium]|nr:cytochrome P450 [Halieaceae bacterium]